MSHAVLPFTDAHIFLTVLDCLLYPSPNLPAGSLAVPSDPLLLFFWVVLLLFCLWRATDYIRLLTIVTFFDFCFVPRD